MAHWEKATECHSGGLRTLTQAGNDKGAGFTVTHPYFSICFSREELLGGFRDTCQRLLLSCGQGLGPRRRAELYTLLLRQAASVSAKGRAGAAQALSGNSFLSHPSLGFGLFADAGR